MRPVVGAVLFASLVSLNWGEGRRVSVGELPSALQSRPAPGRHTVGVDRPRTSGASPSRAWCWRR